MENLYWILEAGEPILQVFFSLDLLLFLDGEFYVLTAVVL
jgi:hypothetical protein